MLTISNGISFIRGPLAFLFLIKSPTIRLVAILAAMLSDSVDGYLARRYQATSRFGAILDPVMDKFFVYFALSVFLFEGKIVAWQMATLISRDFFLCLYVAIVLLRKKWNALVFRSVRWGKVSTALQLIVLISLVYGISFPWIVFAAFVIMGWLTFLELLMQDLSKP